MLNDTVSFLVLFSLERAVPLGRGKLGTVRHQPSSTWGTAPGTGRCGERPSPTHAASHQSRGRTCSSAQRAHTPHLALPLAPAKHFNISMAILVVSAPSQRLPLLIQVVNLFHFLQELPHHQDQI